ncbi:hypothetical protein A3860_09400 [Niastella vici]|uniref:Uncharacterized protein n=1 Tax=Niastella vici TaxID=1703345 RepID=A0A1V9FHM5_9BACT|nr:hypothetical protein [Niastella vici]OQP57830.1 hypothetical protein A3860_09400 [Niastella vici]
MIALDKLVRCCAKRFTLGAAYLAIAFAGLINDLEAYRLEQLKQQAKEKEPIMQLTEAEKSRLKNF